MINKVLYLLAVICLLFMFKTIDSSIDYSIVMEVIGYRVTTNLFSIGLLFIVSILFIRIFIRVKSSILSVMYSEPKLLLQNSFLAFCNEDAKLLSKFAKKSSGIAPIIAKAMRIKKGFIESANQDLLLQDLDALPTELVQFSLINKMDIYLSRSEWVNLKKVADNLWDINPSFIAFSNRLLSAFHMKSWLEAKELIKQGYKTDSITKESHNKLMCVLNYLWGLDLSTSSVDDAISKFKNATNLPIPEPYIEIVKLSVEKGDFKNAISYAKKAWNNFPDKRISDHIISMSKKLSDKDFYSACKAVYAENKNHYESIILMAKGYIAIDDRDSAFSLLKYVKPSDADYRAYIMLALSSVSSDQSFLNKALEAKNKLAKFPRLYWDFSSMSYSYDNSKMSIGIHSDLAN